LRSVEALPGGSYRVVFEVDSSEEVVTVANVSESGGVRMVSLDQAPLSRRTYDIRAVSRAVLSLHDAWRHPDRRC
jgi:ACT domain-containing protein